jgi:hypothetical protein
VTITGESCRYARLSRTICMCLLLARLLGTFPWFGFYAFGLVCLHASFALVGFTTHTARMKDLRLYRGFVRDDRMHTRLIGFQACRLPLPQINTWLAPVVDYALTLASCPPFPGCVCEESVHGILLLVFRFCVFQDTLPKVC